MCYTLKQDAEKMKPETSQADTFSEPLLPLHTSSMDL
jgi:hypothetical protein